MTQDSYFHPLSFLKPPKLPARFTFPFYYEPHNLVELAKKRVEVELEKLEWAPGSGKMFGVLVVKDQQGQLGFLAGYSGLGAMAPITDFFVPPIFDINEQLPGYPEGTKRIGEMTAQLEAAEKDPALEEAKANVKSAQVQADEEIAKAKIHNKEKKAERDTQRKSAESLAPNEQKELESKLVKESVNDKKTLLQLRGYWKERIQEATSKLEAMESAIEALRAERGQLSNRLHLELFERFEVHNAEGEKASLKKIFNEVDIAIPPSGSGECAAPKMLQYAFDHKYTPICMGEFWWGPSPEKEIRKQGQFYPSCRGRCEPILGFMLQGMEVDPNPIGPKPFENHQLEVIFEDEHIAVIHKPAGMLSVPGKHVKDSILERVKDRFPDAIGPLTTHRLDMQTSGLMIIAKNMRVHGVIQKQFIRRHVEKRYVAILEGEIEGDSGEVDLPHRVDIMDRPRQVVCYEHGKPALTKWEVVERKEGRTRIHFYPKTGRTHQLRVHSAHPSGLNAPIVGDDLYGQSSKRLYLHAEEIAFWHPVTKEPMRFTRKADF